MSQLGIMLQRGTAQPAGQRLTATIFTTPEASDTATTSRKEVRMSSSGLSRKTASCLDNTDGQESTSMDIYARAQKKKGFSHESLQYPFNHKIEERPPTQISQGFGRGSSFYVILVIGG